MLKKEVTVVALNRTLERLDGPVVLAGHAYAGAVIGGTRDQKVKALVYVAALAPAEGQTVADAFYMSEPHPKAPKLAPDGQDRMIIPRTQRFMAERMKARISAHPVDHTPSVTAPSTVVEMLTDAVNQIPA